VKQSVICGLSALLGIAAATKWITPLEELLKQQAEQIKRLQQRLHASTDNLANMQAYYQGVPKDTINVQPQKNMQRNMPHA